MEAKPETSNGPAVPKQEIQTPQGPKKNFTQNQNQNQNQQGAGPNMRGGGKKNFQNRGGKMGNMQHGNNRGPMKNDGDRIVSFFMLACSAAIFNKIVGKLKVMSAIMIIFF